MNVWVSKSFIKIEFESKCEKSDLIMYDENDNKISGVTCYKMTNYENIENRYNIYIEYKVDTNVVYSMLEKSMHHNYIGELYTNNKLHINCNLKYVNPYIEKLIEFDIFDILEFGKTYTTTKIDYSKLKKVKRVEYWGKYLNTRIIPNELDTFKYKANFDKCQIIKKTKGTKCVILCNNILYDNKFYKIFDADKSNKILFVSDEKTQLNLSELEPDCIEVYNKNNYVDWTNLPNSVKKLVLCDGFDKTLNYLPNILNEMVFYHNVISSLSDLPSSLNTIKMRDVEWKKFYEKSKELPEFVESIHLSTSNNNYTNDEYLKLPQKLKSIYISSESLANREKIEKDIFDKCKEKYNANFNVYFC
jgi:hypothetical protein